MAVRRVDRNPYRADFVVYDPDEIRIELIIELKMALDDLDAVSENLREAMWMVSCYNGIIVTPNKMFVYRDDLQEQDKQSIHLVADINTDVILNQYAGRGSLSEERTLADAVLSWLEALTSNWHNALPKDMDDQTANAFIPELVGDIAQGRIRHEVMI